MWWRVLLLFVVALACGATLGLIALIPTYILGPTLLGFILSGCLLAVICFSPRHGKPYLMRVMEWVTRAIIRV